MIIDRELYVNALTLQLTNSSLEPDPDPNPNSDPTVNVSVDHASDVQTARYSTVVPNGNSQRGRAYGYT